MKPVTTAAPHLSLAMPAMLPDVLMSAPPVSYVTPLPTRNREDVGEPETGSYSKNITRPWCLSITGKWNQVNWGFYIKKNDFKLCYFAYLLNKSTGNIDFYNVVPSVNLKYLLKITGVGLDVGSHHRSDEYWHTQRDTEVGNTYEPHSPLAALLTAENKGYSLSNMAGSLIMLILMEGVSLNVSRMYSSTLGGAILSGSVPPTSRATHLKNVKFSLNCKVKYN